MNARQRGMLVGAVVLGLPLLLALATVWFLHAFEKVEHQVPLPPAGEAAADPLYALRRVLEADGERVQAHEMPDAMALVGDPRDTVLLHGDPSTVDAAGAQRLLAWVARGGHLVLRTPSRGADPRDVPLLSALGLRQPLRAPHCEPLRVPGQSNHVEFCRGRRFVADPASPPALDWGDDEHGLAWARWRIGRGTVDLLADMDFLETAKLRDVQHQLLARQVLAPNYGRGTFHLVRMPGWTPPWLRLLQRAWPAWLPLVLLLGAALWRHGQRFGPWLPSPPAGRRSLLEHVQASGELLYRRGHLELLHAAMREAFLARLRRRDPATFALDEAARVAALSARLQFPPGLVREALQPPADRHDFHARVRTLVQMRNRL